MSEKKPFISYEEQVNKLIEKYKWQDASAKAKERLLTYVKSYSYMYIKYGFIENMVDSQSSIKRELKFLSSKLEYLIYFIDVSRRVGDILFPYLVSFESHFVTALIHAIGFKNKYCRDDGYIKPSNTLSFFREIFYRQEEPYIKLWIDNINLSVNKNTYGMIWTKNENVYIKNGLNGINKYYLYTWPKILSFSETINIYHALKPEYKKHIDEEIFNKFFKYSEKQGFNYYWIITVLNKLRNRIAHGDSIVFAQDEIIFTKNFDKDRVKNWQQYFAQYIFNIDKDEHIKFFIKLIDFITNSSSSSTNKITKIIDKSINDKFEEDKQILSNLSENEKQALKVNLKKIFLKN